MVELLIALCLLIGAFFQFLAALGVFRMPDLFTRMHAATKATTLGLFFLLLAIIITQPSLEVIGKGLLTIIFIFLTAPVAAHVIAKVALKRGVPIWQKPKIKN